MQRRLALLSIALLLASSAPVLGAGYLGGATFVARLDGRALLDNGGLVCQDSTGDGVGGACLSWRTLNPGATSVEVVDEQAGRRVAFQVCIDNNGDGLCTVGGGTTGCADQSFFSHASGNGTGGGVFHNPLGPLPTVFGRGCPGGFPGWLVFLCQGVHRSPPDATGTGGEPLHTHAASRGTVEPSTAGGSGFGDFCGEGQEQGVPVAKAYRVV